VPSSIAKIKHLVVVMMENRSFDHMFGFLQSPSYPINGLDGTQSNLNAQGKPVTVSADARYGGDFFPDPGHDFLDVNEQVFGNRAAEHTKAGLMIGFIQNYQTHTGDPKKAERIMKCFHPSKVPTLVHLAQQYAICDNWFSSVPGPTLPNRAFSHFGTSMGRLDMSPDYGGNFKTIFEVLETDKKSPEIGSKVYFQDTTLALTFTYLNRNQKKYFGDFRDFVRDCKKNRLPAYCIVEPRFNSSDTFAANDQHPDHDVLEGDFFLSDVYRALRRNKDVWESTMLVITYDEHGGLYDHVPPPAAVNPDGKNSTVPAFKFDRLGVRVPAVVVSAYTKPCTILHEVFDHTSLIAMARKLFTKNFATNHLTERDRLANTFEHAVNQEQARTDDALAVELKAGLSRERRLAAKKPSRKKILPLSELQRSMLQQALAMESQLPVRMQSRKSIHSFRTEDELARFLLEVKEKFFRQATRAAKSRAAVPGRRRRGGTP
jgi:phospholipase C